MGKKTKTFLSAIPFQYEGKLKSAHYIAVGNEKLAYEPKTQFPIIPVIAGYAEKGDSVRVIAVKAEGENYEHNFNQYFAPAIHMLCEQKGLAFNGIEVILTPNIETIDVQLKLFSDIVAVLRENEQLYACITYGTKPTPIVLSMALNYAHRLKKGSSVECIVYGQYLHNESQPKPGFIYDTTSLFYMDSIVNKLAEMRAGNPEKAIRLMLGLEEQEED